MKCCVVLPGECLGERGWKQYLLGREGRSSSPGVYPHWYQGNTHNRMQDFDIFPLQVLCIVKPLAAARYSQIRYQAVVVWTGSDKNMPQVIEPKLCC